MSITSESWWGRESNPPALLALGAKLRDHYNLSADAIGIKGNTAHVYGYHRSANWVRNSAYCTSRTYSVTETAGNRKPVNPDWCCALDATLPHDELLAACKRLDEAVRAGRLEKVTEWYGNDDGDNRVDGYDNIRNVVASSDSSHLWHLHMSFDRGRVAEDHTDVFEILTGEDMAFDETDKKYLRATAERIEHMTATWDEKIKTEWATDNPNAEQPMNLVKQVNALHAKLDQVIAALAAGGGTPVPPTAANVSVTGVLKLEPAPAEPAPQP